MIEELVPVFARHERVAFQFSGGRDSTAALYLLKDFWGLMRVFHLDAGEQFPETRRVVERVGRDVKIEVIKSDVNAYRERVGLASDLVPADNTPVGRLVSGRTIKIVGRYDCCRDNIMLPMHRRMVEEGITLIIRGQRDEDYAHPPFRSGGVDPQTGLEFLYPIESWTGAEVDQYLKANELPVADYYPEGVKNGPECMGCTAWWDDGRLQYMKRFHPKEHAAYKERIKAIQGEIFHQADMLAAQLKES